MTCLRAWMLALLPISALAACGSGGSDVSGGPVAPSQGDAGGSEAGADDAGAPNPLDTLDPSKGPFQAELAKVRELAATASSSGAGTIDRAFIGGDPFLLATALDRVLRATDNGCVNSPFGCPTRAEADELLGQFPVARDALQSALTKALAVVDRYRWLTAAHTAIAFANMLDGASKLDPAARAALAPKISALAAVGAPFEVFQFGAELPASYPRVKALYQLTPGFQAPTAETAAMAREVVLAVAALVQASGAKPGSYAPFAADGSTPSASAPALLTLQRAATLGTVVPLDAGPAVAAYFATLDVVTLKAVQGQASSIDWPGYFAAVDGVAKLLDTSLVGIDLHVPAPGPPSPPSESAFATPPTDRGTLEADPRVFRTDVRTAGTCDDGKGGKNTSTDGVYTMGPDVFGWGTAPAELTPRRVPPGTFAPVKATAIVKTAGTTPIPLSCYTTTSGITTGLARSPACGVPIDFTSACYGKFGPDHLELVVRRTDTGSVVLRHVYRSQPDGTTPRATWFLPRTDDPELVPNAVNQYTVVATTVTKGGTSIRRQKHVYWVEGTPSTTDTKSGDVTPVEAPVDLLPDPTVPSGTFVVQRLGAALRVRPSVDFVLATGTPIKFVNNTSFTLRVRSQFTPGLSDATGLTSTSLGGIDALATPDLAPAGSFDLTTPLVGTESAPHRWSLGVVGQDAVVSTIFAVVP